MLVRSFVIAARFQPTLDPSAETVEGSNALVQERGLEEVNWLVCASVCVTYREGGLSRT